MPCAVSRVCAVPTASYAPPHVPRRQTPESSCSAALVRAPTRQQPAPSDPAGALHVELDRRSSAPVRRRPGLRPPPCAQKHITLHSQPVEGSDSQPVEGEPRDKTALKKTATGAARGAARSPEQTVSVDRLRRPCVHVHRQLSPDVAGYVRASAGLELPAPPGVFGHLCACVAGVGRRVGLLYGVSPAVTDVRHPSG